MQPSLLRRHRWALGLFALFTRLVLLGLALRSRLQTILPDLARPHGRAVLLESAHGPLSAAQSKAILKGLKGVATQPASSIATWRAKRRSPTVR